MRLRRSVIAFRLFFESYSYFHTESYKQLLNTTVLVEVPERVGIILDTLSITDYMVRYGAMQVSSE